MNFNGDEQFLFIVIELFRINEEVKILERKWWKESVVYQIYPRSFKDSNGDGIGDLNGIIEKLDYIKELGANVIWLNPVYKSPNDDMGYDISDYRDIMDEFGTMDDWERLLKKAHENDIKIVMDLVVNHTSDEHEWFIESRKSRENPFRDYYIWRDPVDGKEPNNWASFFEGPAWEFDQNTGQYYLHLFSKKQPDLNWENEKVRNEVYDMMKFWLDKGIDGFRMDVINMLSKVPGLPPVETDEKGFVFGDEYFINGPRIHEFLKEMNDKVLSKYDIMTVGETPGVTPEIAAMYVGKDRNELNMVFQFEQMDLDKGENYYKFTWDLLEFKKIMKKWQEGLYEKGWNSLYLNNHDQPRMVSRFGNDGKYRVESAKMLATMIHTQQGTPYIYQGEEIGMTNISFPTIEDYKDIATINLYYKAKEAGFDEDLIMKGIHYHSRDNARTPIQWNSEKNAGFTTGTPWIKVNPNYKEINVENALKDKNSIFYYYRDLIKLRKKHPVIVYGKFEIVNEDDPDIFAYTRTGENEKLFVILNFTDKERKFKPEVEERYDNILISNYERIEPGNGEYSLRPYEARVYIKKI